MQELRSPVRYSECDENGRLSLGGLVNYFQDTAEYQGDQAGIGYRYLKDRGLAWLLSSWQIIIPGKLPELGTEITSQTWCYAFQGLYGLRNFRLLGQDGSPAAWANSVWFLYSSRTGLPVRVPQDIADRFGIEPKLDMDYAPRKVPPVMEGRRMEPIEITRQYLDTNHHVNNEEYIRLALQSLTDQVHFTEMRAEYRKQAFLGDIVVPWVETGETESREGKRCAAAVSLKNESGDVFMTVRLLD